MDSFGFAVGSIQSIVNDPIGGLTKQMGADLFVILFKFVNHDQSIYCRIDLGSSMDGRSSKRFNKRRFFFSIG